MKHLYFVRHGESQANMRGMWGDKPGSKHDLPLTEKGRSQAVTGAEELVGLGVSPDLIICSPLGRAQETAVIYAKKLGYPLDKIEVSELFVEIQVGELEGTSYAEFVKHHTYADLGQFKGAETIETMQQRARRALDYARSRPEATVLVVSHSAFGRAFIREAEGRPYTDEFAPGLNTSLPYATPLKLV